MTKTEIQDMSIMQLLLEKTMIGEQLDIFPDDGEEKFETIKDIQVIPGTDDVVVETIEGSKVCFSIYKIYPWKVVKRKQRIKPDYQLKPKKRFRK